MVITLPTGTYRYLGTGRVYAVKAVTTSDLPVLVVTLQSCFIRGPNTVQLPT